jgi:hypothetical protein
VVKDMTLPDAVAVPRRLGGPLEYVTFSRVIAPGPARLRSSDKKAEDDQHDVTILFADPGQVLGDDLRPFDFDSEQYADIRRCRPGETILATHGYPKKGQTIEYDAGQIRTLAHIVPGIYEGEIYEGVHAMRGDFSDYTMDETGTPSGMSGAPVVLCSSLGDPLAGAPWKAGIAGMVVRGGPAGVNFVETRTLLAYAVRFVQLLAAEGL